MTDELLDIVNDADIVIDQQMRSIAHQLGLQHRGVHVLLFTREGRMLVQKRSADRAASPSAWDCSISEHVHAGESYLEAAIRGMQEEMGIENTGIKAVVKIKMNYGVNDNEISTIYEGMVDPEVVKFDPGEIEQINYYNIAEIQKMMGQENIKFCKWFVEILNWYTQRPADLDILKSY